MEFDTGRGDQMSEQEKSHALVVHKRKESFDVYIGRPSKWGNPFVIGPHGTREQVIELYREWINQTGRAYLRECARKELRGKRLGCYCAPLACHGDVLAEIANELND